VLEFDVPRKHALLSCSCKCFAGWANSDCIVDVSGSGICNGSVSGSDSGSSSGRDCGGVECDADHGGPDCNACEEDIYGGGCVTDCDIKTTCSWHGRCSGWDGSCKCFAGWANSDCIVNVSGNDIGSGSVSGRDSGSGLVLVKTGEFLEGSISSRRVGPTQRITTVIQGLHKSNNGILDLVEDRRSLQVNLEGTSYKVKVS
jgi:hypothetical protein